MNSEKERDNRSEELKDSDLDKVAGGAAGDGVEPPPSDGEELHGAEPEDGTKGPEPGFDDPDKL